jgi:hypothetical protein
MNDPMFEDIFKMFVGAIFASLLWCLYIIHIRNEAVDHGVGMYVCSKYGTSPHFRWATPKVIVNGQ